MMCPSGIRRRRFQSRKFSLKTLLIMIALIAALGGLYGRRVELMNRERAAARRVMGLGGELSYAGQRTLQGEAVTTRLVSYLLFDDFDHVSAVVFRNAPVKDKDVEVLRSFRRVAHVTLTGPLVTDGCIQTLINLPHLRSVSLWRTGVTDAGIKRLRAQHPLLMVYR